MLHIILLNFYPLASTKLHQLKQLIISFEIHVVCFVFGRTALAYSSNSLKRMRGFLTNTYKVHEYLKVDNMNRHKGGFRISQRTNIGRKKPISEMVAVKSVRQQLSPFGAAGKITANEETTKNRRT